jgi:hypothetical protein
MEWLYSNGTLQGVAAPPVPAVTRILAADLGARPCHGYAEYDPETETVTYSAAPPVPSCWGGLREERCIPLLPGWQGPGWYACYRRETPRYFRLHAIKADPYRASPPGPSTVSKGGT